MIKGSIQEEDITIINIYAPNIGAPQYVRQMLTSMKEEILKAAREKQQITHNLNVNGLNATTKRQITGWMDTKTRSLYMLSTRDQPQRRDT